MRKKQFFNISVVASVLVASFISGYMGIDLAQRTTREIFNEKRVVISEDSALIAAVEKTSPAVVSIIDKNQKDLSQAIGSGFIISADGLVVTNSHVVSKQEKDYLVLTHNKQYLQVIKIERSPENDIAIIKVKASNLPVVILGNSDSLREGQRVIAIGSVLGKFDNTVTSGVISGKNRTISAGSMNELFEETIKNVIQIDAALNPGNSGGPLVNLSGEVVGVNFALTEGAENIGFVVPIDVVKKFMTQSSGKVS